MTNEGAMFAMQPPAHFDRFISRAFTVCYDFEEVPIMIGCCRFDETMYDDSLFKWHEIELPEMLRKASRRRRSQFLAGRISASLALKRLKSASLDVGMDFDRSPVWPDGICGSISHTKDFAVCACTSRGADVSIGIDVEEYQDPSLLDTLVPLAVRPEEITVLSDQDPHVAGIIVFSAKEALYKAIYPLMGVYVDYLDVELVSYIPTQRELSFRFRCGAIANRLQRYSIDVRWRPVHSRVFSACVVKGLA